MSFLSKINPSTMLTGIGFMALSERLRNQSGPIARTARAASLALSAGLVIYSIRQAYYNSFRTTLNLSNNRLTTPPNLSYTPALTTLDLADNRLTTPPDLRHTPALTTLRLGSNQLTASPNLSHTPLLTELRLGNNQLTTPPDLSHTPMLTTLGLGRNQLTVSPNLSHTPALIVLYLGGNQLTASPNLSHTPLLTELHLENNQLTTPPDLSHTPLLTELHLGGNQLTVSPDLSHTPGLTTLDLGDNQLTASPNLSHTPGLTTLDLRDNQLTASPNLSHTPALTELHLEGNRLTTPPDLSHTPGLTRLALGRNQLTASPDVSHTPGLTSLELERNQLTALHDSILHLPRDGDVNADENRFSAAYVAAFQQRLEAHRLQHPGQGPNVHMSISDDVVPEEAETQTLEERLREWSNEFEEMYPTALGEFRPPITDTNAQTYFEPLLTLSDDEKSILNQYLRRLRNTNDYRHGTPASKRNVVLRVERMLRLACENPEFKQKMLALISEGLTTCGDRVLIMFNDIEIQWHIHQTRSEPELRELLVRVERYEQLREHAKKIAQERGLGDEIETILHYHIALTGALDLPISTNGMLYQAMSGVNQTMLKTARDKIAALSDKDLLSRSEHWSVYLAKKHADAVSAINQKFTNLLDAVEEYYGLENPSEKQSFLETHTDLAQFLKSAKDITDYLSACNSISRQRTAAITALGSEPTDTLFPSFTDGKERKIRYND